MTQASYPYRRLRPTQYIFISIGRKRIKKVVDFVPIGRNRMNLGFGDLLCDGSIDDKANSNNGDIVKVLATVKSTNGRSQIIRFDPCKEQNFVGFLIKRIS